MGEIWIGEEVCVSFIIREAFGEERPDHGYRNDDPWSQTGRYNTPFDQPFYLILNVAVGGTGGYFT